MEGLGMKPEDDEVARDLFNRVLESDWDEVIRIYTKHKGVWLAKFSNSGDTALHIVVLKKEKKVRKGLIKDLLATLSYPEAKTALRIQNDRGLTPLHLAASIGNVNACQEITSVDSTLIMECDTEGETPLFSAVRHDHLKAFVCLHKAPHPKIELVRHRRKDNGLTLLHCAIEQENFEIASYIIHESKELVTCVDVDGRKPIHYLAMRPTVFKSQFNYGWMGTIPFRFVPVKSPRKRVKQLQRLPTTMNESNEADSNSLDKFLDSKLNRLRDIINRKFLPKISAAKLKHEWALIILELLIEKDKNLYSYENFGAEPGEIYSEIPSCSPLFQEMLEKLQSENEDVVKEEKEDDRNKENTEEDEVGESDIVVTKEQIQQNPEEQTYLKKDKKKSVLILATKDGIAKMVDKILDGEGKIVEVKKQTQQKPEEEIELEKDKRRSVLILAAKKGIEEMVREILLKFPMAIEDVDEDGNNVVLLAAKYKRITVYRFLLHHCSKRKIAGLSLQHVFQKVDKDGNSVLHLAADKGGRDPSFVPGAAMEMQWAYKWYGYVFRTQQHHLVRYNNKMKTAEAILEDSHKDLVNSAKEWYVKTSEAYSLVAALIATVAFTTASTVPGGTENGISPLETSDKAPSPSPFPPRTAFIFHAYSISSLMALGLSIFAVFMFLSIITSRFQKKEFHRSLPFKLLLGMSMMFLAIISVFVSYITGHNMALSNRIERPVHVIYGATSVPVVLFFFFQLPLYFDLFRAVFHLEPIEDYWTAY